MDTTEKRRRWTVRRRLEGWKIQDIATALRTNEKTDVSDHIKELATSTQQTYTSAT